MIYVRDDDVLMDDKSNGKAFRQFLSVHDKIRECPLLLHVPTIVVSDLSGKTEVIEFIKFETRKGRMRPEIHGWKHVDYGKLTEQETRDDLRKCKDWMSEFLDVTPTKWYTPWGASQPHLHKVAKEETLELVDCSDINKLRGRHGVPQRIKEGYKIADLLNEKEIFMHFWEKEAVERLNLVVEHLNAR